jgi:hypothetical protein
MKIYGSKIMMFTDFVSRNYQLDAVKTFYVYEEFKKFFKPTDDELINYCLKYGLFSGYYVSLHSEKYIDFDHFIETNPDIINKLVFKYPDYETKPIYYIKEYIFSDGQFERIQFKYIDKSKSSISELKKSVCTVFLNTNHQSESTCGFLYKVENEYYLVTAYELIANNPEQQKIYGLFENDTNTQICEFLIIGFDKIANVLMGYYHKPDLINSDLAPNYNNIRNTTLEHQNIYEINFSINPIIGKNIYMVGNLADDDNLTTINGTIIKDNYGGGFTINQSNEIMPESVLINSYVYDTIIGSPVFYSENIDDNTKPIYIISMVSKMFNNDGYSMNSRENIITHKSQITENRMNSVADLSKSERNIFVNNTYENSVKRLV